MNKGVFDKVLLLNKNLRYRVVTHAVNDENTFLKILGSGKIMLPSKTGAKKKTPFMEKVLEIDDCVYLSGGFTYNGTSFQNWPYGFIFKRNILKEKSIETYNSFIISRANNLFVRRLKESNPELLIVLSKMSEVARKEVNDLLKTNLVKWWLIEKEISKVFERYPHKKEYTKYIRDFMKGKRLKNSYAPFYLAKDYLEDHNKKKIEIISRKDISLENENFLGVYIDRSKMKEILPMVKKYLKGKFVYDGYKVIKL